MNQTELEKQAQIGRQAMNIQCNELVYSSANSDGEPIEGTEYSVMAIYNLENISAKEVEDIVNNGIPEHEPRILLATPEQFAKIFPHAGETKKNGGYAYWRSQAYKNNHIHCECSCCGFVIEALQAIEYGSSSDDYVGVKYRFCPKCGSVMGYKPPKEEKEEE